MTRHSSISLHRLRGLLTGALAAAVLGLLAGCGSGGGGDDPAPPAPTATPPGPPVTVTVGAAGGDLVFTASGVAGRLSFPAGALAADTAITVTPAEPAAGEWARLDVSGPSDVLDQPATLTLTLPAGSTLDAAAAVTQLGTEGDVLLPSSVDTAARQVSVPVQRFRASTRTVRQAGDRKQALTTLPGDPASTLILNQRLLVNLRVITAEARYQQLVRARDYSSTLELSMSIAALLQSSGLDGYDAAALPWLQRAQAGACENLRGAMERARSEPPPTTFDLKGEIAAAYVTRLSAPVLYWSSVADRLGGSCPGLDPSAALSGVHERLLGAIADLLLKRHDVASLRGAVGEAAAAKALKRQADTLAATRRGPRHNDERRHALGSTAEAAGRRGRLDAATNPALLGAQIRDEVMVPALEPLRGAHWQAGGADATQDHYRYSLAVYGAAGPLADDLQMVRTSLEVASSAGTESLGTGRGGGGATPRDTVGDITVPARKGGRIDLSGPIDVLRCPNAANERLVIDFEGATVLDRASAGGKLLETAQQLGVDTLLAAANIDPATEGTHTLRVRRVGSSCNATFGLADAVLMRVRLDFRAGKPPPPSLIAGKSFIGTLVSYYAPYHNPDCSRSCLANFPGETRCRINAVFDFEVAVTGTPAEYTMATRTRQRLAPEFGATWRDRVFKGPGTATAAGGYQFGDISVTGPYPATGGLSLNAATGDVTGTIVGMCSEEEFTAR